MEKHAKKKGEDNMEVKEQLNEKLSVAELRFYEGTDDLNNVDKSTYLSNVFIARDENTAFDLFEQNEYPVYIIYEGKLYPANKMTSDKPNIGDLFCVVKYDVEQKEDVIQHMIDSPNFFYQRLPYLEERFRLYSKTSSFTLPLLKSYKKKIQKDMDSIKNFKQLLLKRCNLVNQSKDDNAYKKTTNQY